MARKVNSRHKPMLFGAVIEYYPEMAEMMAKSKKGI